MSKPILTITNLCKEYRSDKGTSVHALNDISLTINEGEIFGLLGVNGAGKTTLSSILATLHPATSGTILFKGESIYTNLIAYRRSLGFCPQKQNLDPELSVEENLIFAGRYLLMPEETIQHRVNNLMEQLELTRYAKFNVNALSGGNKQRILIGRALMHSPSIIILDEPTVGLDPDIRRTLWKLIRSLKDAGITTILTTHYLDEAEVLSDRICILHKGKIRLIESVATLKEQHQLNNLEEIFIKLTKEYEKEAV
ncbi:MAG TPA: ABC transporter ATP-binding protein [Candidatus Babeliales bacterium]|nr:ABC transporter ATP-binding protein [Candidatus Babeliales bacterium]